MGLRHQLLGDGKPGLAAGISRKELEEEKQTTHKHRQILVAIKKSSKIKQGCVIMMVSVLPQTIPGPSSPNQVERVRIGECDKLPSTVQWG